MHDSCIVIYDTLQRFLATMFAICTLPLQMSLWEKLSDNDKPNEREEVKIFFTNYDKEMTCIEQPLQKLSYFPVYKSIRYKSTLFFDASNLDFTYLSCKTCVQNPYYFVASDFPAEKTVSIE